MSQIKQEGMRPMIKHKRMTAAAALVAGVSMFLAACGGDSGTSSPTPTPTATEETPGTGTEVPASESVALEFQDIQFSVEEIRGAAGQPVEIALHNAGVLVHDFTIDSFDGEASLNGESASTGDWDVHVSLEADADGTLTLTPSAAGTYTFYCSVLGHREAGMEGTFVVE